MSKKNWRPIRRLRSRLERKADGLSPLILWQVGLLFVLFGIGAVMTLYFAALSPVLFGELFVFFTALLALCFLRRLLSAAFSRVVDKTEIHRYLRS